jgi:hypothetical protein
MFSKQDPPKFREQSGNVYENKGTLWKTWERSWNFVENKRTYGDWRRILLKTKALLCDIAGGGCVPNAHRHRAAETCRTPKPPAEE